MQVEEEAQEILDSYLARIVKAESLKRWDRIMLGNDPSVYTICHIYHGVNKDCKPLVNVMLRTPTLSLRKIFDYSAKIELAPDW